ncbi:MAG: hypothetical protein K5793_08455 [Nitrosarchaeum sp.]|nr:hypothetical protein [Nitrosarchaeum sp.]MCV0399073.1 hypothetical protein [Nitrosarchaeum sp.]
MGKKQSQFDPDKLALTKEQILDFCDRVIEKWNKNPSKNAKNIFAMNAVKTSVLWTDDDSLKAIWGEILNWTFELFYENALAQGQNEDSDWSNVMKKLKNKK